MKDYCRCPGCGVCESHTRIAALEAELIEAFKRVNFISEDAEMELREAYAHVALVDTKLAASTIRLEDAEAVLRWIALRDDSWADYIDDYFARYKD